MSFPPIEGRCLFWSNRRPDGVMDKRTLHGGDVVTSGEKFGLNIWVRDGPWVQPTDPPESVFAPAFVLDNGSDDAEPRPTAPPLRVGSLPENATTYTAPPPL
mmetsp:Transcript_64721/g.153034  ORF Transcript_64721/g.153034 Transcript_64721/m.153034 type:complete len:102 (+) Transcript_64721:504-809(+)